MKRAIITIVLVVSALAIVASLPHQSNVLNVRMSAPAAQPQLQPQIGEALSVTLEPPALTEEEVVVTDEPPVVETPVLVADNDPVVTETPCQHDPANPTVVRSDPPAPDGYCSWLDFVSLPHDVVNPPAPYASWLDLMNHPPVTYFTDKPFDMNDPETYPR